MRLLFNKQVILEELFIARDIISTKNITSILSNVLMIVKENKLVIKATDLKINFETQVSAQIAESGSITLYCEKFIGILNSLPSGEIEICQDQIDQDENKNDLSTTVIIRSADKKIQFQMRSMLQEKFPEFYFEDDISYFEVVSKDLKEMIAQTSFAVSEEDTRYFMNGVFFEKKNNDLNLVATDGRRLSFISKSILENVDDFPAAIVHPKILNIILKCAPDEGTVSIAITQKMIFFKFANYRFAAVLLEGQFPNYARVIPKKQSFIFIVKRLDLIDALTKRIVLMVDKRIGRIYFDISSDVLKITAFQTEVGSAEEYIPCEFSGNPYVIAFNFRYIEEPLKVIKTESIAFEFTEDMKAVTMRPEPAKDYFHIIMPMQKE